MTKTDGDVRRIHVAGVELGMAAESHYKTRFEPLRLGPFSHVRTDNAGIPASQRFREIAHASVQIA